jgi:hypothetical protein
MAGTYSARENIMDNIKISPKYSLVLHELKQHKLWFDEECSQFLDHGKQVKMQWLQNKNQIYLNILNNI